MISEADYFKPAVVVDDDPDWISVSLLSKSVQSVLVLFASTGEKEAFQIH